MNNFLNKLERKIGNKSIPHLTSIIVGCYLVGYAILLAKPEFIEYMYLDPYFICKGQIWRIITWIIVPPQSLDIFTIIMLFFYFSIGSSLEKAWGDFRYNVYIFSGMIISIIVAFITYFITSAIVGGLVSMGGVFSTYYVCMSILLAFAFTFPDAGILLWFVIPLKVKWLGVLYGVFILYDIITDIRYFITTGKIGFIISVVAIVASLANFIIFFIGNRKNNTFIRNAQNRIKRKVEERKRADMAANGNAKTYVPGSNVTPIARHRCSVCGRTELTNPELEFRYCSKCVGAHEYCSDHLYTHEHVQQ